MGRGRNHIFSTIKTEGAILPSDLLERIADGDRTLEGLAIVDYHLAKTEKISEAVSRSWNRMLGLWKAFREVAEALPESDRGTTLTRERWLLPLFQELGYGRLSTHRARDIGGKSYPISHQWNLSPIHLTSFKYDLDQRSEGVAGASRMSPHGMAQEFLNRSEEHLWAFVSNGLRLRILRDNISLTRQAYVEFDLEALFEGEAYSDFTMLWLLCHESRVAGEEPEECWLEKWSRTAREEGARALDQLRVGVEEAITILGRGFLKHSANASLRDALRSGNLKTQDYYRELLRLVYRLIFLFVAEDRNLLLDPEGEFGARERYSQFYSTRRLRNLAGKRKGGRHVDLYEALKIVFGSLGSPEGCQDLAIKPLGSFLWSDEAISWLDGMIANRDLLDVIRSLAYRISDGVMRPVDYKNLRSEELGSVYEALLELQANMEGGEFQLITLSGHERKASGSYYTPDSLVQCLLDSALEPVISGRLEVASKETKRKPGESFTRLAEKELLSLKICDPACGSGHFLVSAAHRLGKQLASVRTGDDEPSPTAYSEALRDVIGACIYGVDINPMTVELCKIALWMEAMVPGRPLSFLEHKIKCGNSLIGATPELLEKGIPNDAYKPMEGDNPSFVRDLKRRNAAELKGQLPLELVERLKDLRTELTQDYKALESLNDGSINELQVKEKHFAELKDSETYRQAKFQADAWCSAFMFHKIPDIPAYLTESLFRKIQRDPTSVANDVFQIIKQLAAEYQFFHWQVEFPQVFLGQKEEGGFDVVLGNPPWERVKLQEKEWFSLRHPDIANAPNAATRRRMIESLKEDNLQMYEAFLQARRKSEGEGHYLRDSRMYPLCGRGDVNTYTVFAELNRTLLSPMGRAGMIVPSGIATDDTTKYFFQDIMEKGSLVCLFDFENRENLFPSVDSRMKFCLLTLTGTAPQEQEGTEFAFFLHNVGELKEDERTFVLSAKDINLINPNTKTCPIFRSRKDAELTKKIYSKIPVLKDENHAVRNTWGVSFSRMFDMANDSHLFLASEDLKNDGWILRGNIFEKNSDCMLPLYEAKMATIYDHRSARVVISPTAQIRQGQPEYLTDAEHEDPYCLPVPRMWIHPKHIHSLPNAWSHNWFLVWRRVSSPTNERTTLPTLLPYCGIGDSVFILLPTIGNVKEAACLLANMSTYIFDYMARQKMGGVNMSYFIFSQLPVLEKDVYQNPAPWSFEILQDWITERSVELTCTAWDLVQFSEKCGLGSSPYMWAHDRRFLIRCELDAAFFHLYEINRDDVNYIMETFPIVKKKDEQKSDEYRTKLQILEIYDRMQKAMDSGQPYQTLLDPSPAEPSLTHPDEPPDWLKYYTQPITGLEEPSNYDEKIKKTPMPESRAADQKLPFRDDNE